MAIGKLAETFGTIQSKPLKASYLALIVLISGWLMAINKINRIYKQLLTMMATGGEL